MIQTLRVASALSEIKKNLTVDVAEQEAHWILMDVLQCSFADIVIHQDKNLTPEQIQLFRSHVRDRNTGKPLAYVLGHQDFYKHRFFVNHNVLIPRPETELIVELATTRGPFNNIADLGAGSGCIGISLLKEFQDARLWTCDISTGALEIFNKNAQNLRVDSRAEAVLGSVTSFTFTNTFDLVVSNPPYISEVDSRVESDVLKFEPHTALFAPEDGLAYYKSWSQWTWQALQKGGVALFEIGSGQHDDVESLFRKAGFKHITKHKDLFGIERVVCATKE
ncbi:MAG: peptide chain release factor N(5)-glutamine methyltransferase [Bdellovibrionaceae bacterium]|nr:peptide chain release factor N(5)-glutamine methyltransferase [Pseudobdellovibrionaceae bacterium]